MREKPMPVEADMNHFLAAFRRLMEVEGGYANSKKDLGGETMWGITEKVARANGYKGLMADMPLETARAIAKVQYWDLLNLDRVAALSPAIAEELFDTFYNTGRGPEYLQRALNALNREEADYPDLPLDGLIGPATLSALGAYLRKRGPEGETVLLRVLNCLQGARYIQIAEARPGNEDFVFGWFRHRIAIGGGA